MRSLASSQQLGASMVTSGAGANRAQFNVRLNSRERTFPDPKAMDLPLNLISCGIEGSGCSEKSFLRQPDEELPWRQLDKDCGRLDRAA